MREARASSRSRSILRSALGVVVFVAMSAGFSACSCKENRAATRACAKAVSNTACKACCGMHGSNVTSFVNRCTCY